MPRLLPGQYERSRRWKMFEALKLIAATFAALFPGDLNILTDELSAILASWFLILLTSRDFHLYLLILLVIMRILFTPEISPSPKITFYTHLGTPIATKIGSHRNLRYIDPSISIPSISSVFMSPLIQLGVCGLSL